MVEITILSRGVEFLPDYCPRCNPLGHHADSRTRLASLTDPRSITWLGDKRLICDYYNCVACRHEGRRVDLWTAMAAGFDPRNGGRGRPCQPHP